MACHVERLKNRFRAVATPHESSKIAYWGRPLLLPMFQVAPAPMCDCIRLSPDHCTRRITPMWLEEKLQRDLNHPRADVRLNLSKCRRFDVADWQPEIGVVQDIEKLATELEFLAFR